MFTIYNKGSVQFRGTSDNLYNLERIDHLAQSRLKPDNETFVFMDDNSKKGKNTYTNEAINKYKEIAHMDTTDIVYHVQDIMTTECITIQNDSTLEEAYIALKENKISQLPIVTNSNKIVGLINKKIILNMLMDDIEQVEVTLRKRLYDVDLKEVITTDPISDIRRVAKVMLMYKLGAVPVVNSNDILVGIVSKTDILKAVSYIPNLKLWA